MKIEKLTFREKGKLYSGEIVWPDSLQTAVALLGQQEVWDAFKIGYKEIVKARIAGRPILPRKKIVKLDVSRLDDQTRAVIEQLVAMQAAPQEPKLIVESAPLEEPQINLSDSDEMQEEAQVPTSQNETSFEEDFAKYLSSLGS